ncbi:hypothetical protein [Bergeyella cardium]|uniref:Uncharacterized protein n=1 Tax=Bergeyella cardium TaxID=1585976 RepID=A0A6P1QVL8_9FLAO|nr:hypothetical protein [Bergeyella cardium]QHN65618.1 hypothetical protein DBX24_06865 [Bergeyella cardium]WHE33206.1 hypothetical protein P8603_06905 [Bergeyella cardium]WHF59856.1 hypothetical protein O0R51_06905 [Bergeyella cardium]
MLKRTLLFVSLGSGLLIDAQAINEAKAATKTSGKVGINTDIPTRTLTIKNSTANDGKPLLRLVDAPIYSKNVGSAMDADLGGNTATATNYTDYRPLLVDAVGDVYKGLPINNMSILTLTIDKVKGDYIRKFDTGIDYNKYAVAIMSATFKMPDPGTGKIVMLRAGNGVIPSVDFGGGKYGVTTAPAIVLLKKTQLTNNWEIYADYPNISSYEFVSGSTDIGNLVNGTWVITLLVGKRDAVNFTELNFNQGGSAEGIGNSNTTYATQLQNFLQKLE